MRKEIVGRLARQIGQVLEVKLNDERDVVGRYVRAKVVIDVRESLGRGAMLSVKHNPPVLIQVKYERLLYFCFTCGCLGHTFQYCDQQPSEDNIFPYGNFMVASPKAVASKKFSREKKGTWRAKNNNTS